MSRLGVSGLLLFLPLFAAGTAKNHPHAGASTCMSADLKEKLDYSETCLKDHLYQETTCL